jgi:hypothetical protein
MVYRTSLSHENGQDFISGSVSYSENRAVFFHQPIDGFTASYINQLEQLSNEFLNNYQDSQTVLQEGEYVLKLASGNLKSAIENNMDTNLAKLSTLQSNVATALFNLHLHLKDLEEEGYGRTDNGDLFINV